MGVLRLTPDAFTDSGVSPARAAVADGRRMISEGADIVEICCAPCHSGEPAATHRATHVRTTRDGRANQVAGVAEALAADVRVAVATGSWELATEAVAAGATLICEYSPDPSARRSPVHVAAGTGAGWVAVAGPNPSAAPAGDVNGRRCGGTSVVAGTVEALGARADRANAAGVGEILLDPGIGCGRAAAEDLDLLAGLAQLAALGRPLVVGTGDGRLMDELHAAADARRLPVADVPGDGHADRLEGALVVAVWAMLAGVAVVRTHHVAATVEAARVVGAKQPVGTS